MAGTTAQVRILPESMHKAVGSKQQQHQQIPKPNPNKIPQTTTLIVTNTTNPERTQKEMTSTSASIHQSKTSSKQ